MYFSPILTPDAGDHPTWKTGGTAGDIPILYLTGGPLHPLSGSAVPDPWRIQAYTPDGYDDTIRYLRELATAAMELADQLAGKQRRDTRGGDGDD